VSPERLGFWDEKRKAWIVEPGAFEVMVGSSSADVRLKGEIKATTAGQWTPAQTLRVVEKTGATLISVKGRRDKGEGTR
jgi:Fibronectin type III-like domain